MSAPGGAVPQRLPLLDLLRFLAAMGVLAYHYGFRGAIQGKYLAFGYPELAPWVRFGYLAMDFLFVLSGFVILFSVEAAQGSVRRFVASRAARLYPAFLAAAAITYALVAPRDPPFGLPPQDALWNLTLIPGWFGARAIDGAYWTLAVELNFYALVLLCLLWPRRLPVDRVLWLWAAVQGLAWWRPDLPPAFHFFAISPWGGFFLLGAVAYRLFRAGVAAPRVALLGVAIALALHALHIQVGVLSEAFGLPLPVLPSLVAMAVLGLVFATLCTRPALLARGGPWAVLLGGITYPLYLVHQKIGYLLLTALAPEVGRWPALALTLAFVLTLAWAIHRWVERPFNPPLRRAIEAVLRTPSRRRAAPPGSPGPVPVAERAAP